MWRAWNCALHIWSMSSVIEIRFYEYEMSKDDKKYILKNLNCNFFERISNSSRTKSNLSLDGMKLEHKFKATK